MASKAIELGAGAAQRAPIVGRHIGSFFDQAKLLDNLLQQEGLAELERRRAELEVLEALPSGEDEVEKRRVQAARLAAELLAEHIEDIPTALQTPVELLVEQELPPDSASKQ